MPNPSTSRNATVSVAGLRPGDRAEISHVEGARDMVQRLAMIGIRPGVRVELLHGPGSRGAVLRVGGGRIALGRSVIDHVMVVPEAGKRSQEAAQ